jgi:hypothetical protein
MQKICWPRALRIATLRDETRDTQRNRVRTSVPILDLYGKKLEGESIDSEYVVTDSCIGYRFRDA